MNWYVFWCVCLVFFSGVLNWCVSAVRVSGGREIVVGRLESGTGKRAWPSPLVSLRLKSGEGMMIGLW